MPNDKYKSRKSIGGARIEGRVEVPTLREAAPLPDQQRPLGLRRTEPRIRKFMRAPLKKTAKGAGTHRALARASRRGA